METGNFNLQSAAEEAPTTNQLWNTEEDSMLLSQERNGETNYKEAFNVSRLYIVTLRDGKLQKETNYN